MNLFSDAERFSQQIGHDMCTARAIWANYARALWANLKIFEKRYSASLNFDLGDFEKTGEVQDLNMRTWDNGP